MIEISNLVLYLFLVNYAFCMKRDSSHSTSLRQTEVYLGQSYLVHSHSLIFLLLATIYIHHISFSTETKKVKSKPNRTLKPFFVYFPAISTLNFAKDVGNIFAQMKHSVESTKYITKCICR